MTKKCLGCGSTLQCDDKTKNGYYPSTLAKPQYCERCFKLIHYSKGDVGTLIADENKIIETVNKKAKLVFFLIDFLNISEETIAKYNCIKKKKVLVICKSDIIPKSIKSPKIKSWLNKTYGVEEDVIFVSANKKYNLNKIPKMMQELGINESYILGYTNSGKSTLINAIFEKIKGTKGPITTSTVPNTTLDFIKTKIDDLTIIDTPGFALSNTIYSNEDQELIKRINIKGNINPITYQTKENTVINIEDKVLIVSHDINSFTLYMSNYLNINKSFKLPKNNLNKYELAVEDNSDLLIKGIGFINIKKKCNIDVYVVDDNLLSVRKSCF